MKFFSDTEHKPQHRKAFNGSGREPSEKIWKLFLGWTGASEFGVDREQVVNVETRVWNNTPEMFCFVFERGWG